MANRVSNIVMKSLLTSLFLFSLTVASLAQYNDPYRMTYDGNSYYVTNKGNGTVTKIDSVGATSTAISGLYSPNDIFYGSVAGNSVILILDSNTIKIYDSTTLGNLLNLPITGAVDAHDGVFNPNNTNEFFISDRGDDKIIKGTIGSAPFFPISYSTLCTGIFNPTGITFNTIGKLIVVSDTTAGKVYEVDIASGNKTVVLNSTRDYLNDVVQDAQGNYYITNWGDDRLYRYSSTWTDETSINNYNNPSGLYANLTDGLLGICCTNCQKVSFSLFHLFSPLDDIVTCQQDSFWAFLTPIYKGIGTYESGNEFRIEMSDSNGSFANPIHIGTRITDVPPIEIRCVIPSGTYADTGYLYRIRSTAPRAVSFLTKEVTILTPPATRLGGAHTYSGCVNTNISVTLPVQTDVIYTFTPSATISEISPGNYVINQGVDTTLAIHLLATDTSTGCISTDSIFIYISDSLTISGLANSVAFCEGDTVVLSPDKAALEYYWSVRDTLTSLQESSFSAARDSLLYSDITPQLQTIYLHAKDNAGCRGLDSVKITVNKIPDVGFTLQELEFCIGDTIFRDYTWGDSISFTYVNNYQTPLSSGGWLADSVGRFGYELKYSYISTGCSDVFRNGYGVHYRDDSIRITNEGDYLAATIYGESENKASWFINGKNSIANDTLNANRLEDGDSIFAMSINNSHCWVFSNAIIWKTLGIEHQFTEFSIYPNPSSGRFTIKSGTSITRVEITDVSGRLIMTRIDGDWDFELPNGFYYVTVYTSEGMGRRKIVITE